MKKRLPIIAGVLVGLAVVVYVALCVVVYNQLSLVQAKCGDHPVEAVFTPSDFHQTPDSNNTELDTTPYLMPVYEDVTFPSRDSKEVTISGFYVPAQGAAPESAPTVIVVHGINDCKRRAVFLTAGGMLNKHGFNVLMMDMRNHGDSMVTNGRAAAGSVEYKDVLGAWDWLIAEKGATPETIGVLGFSLGAGTSMIAAGQEPRIAAVWEDSGYGALDKIIRSELGRIGMPEFLQPGAVIAGEMISGDNILEYEPLQEVKKIGSRPFFIVHGDADMRVKVDNAKELAAAINANGGNVTPWITAGSIHIESVWDYPEEYEAKLAAFFSESLGGGN